jgi:hypothetical protein
MNHETVLISPLLCEAGEGWGGGEREVATASVLAPLPASSRRRGEGRNALPGARP